MTSVNHMSTRFRGSTHSPCSGCENGVNKSELSFDIWWLYLNGTTPQYTIVYFVLIKAFEGLLTFKLLKGEKFLAC